jgi:hypothetical protein
MMSEYERELEERVEQLEKLLEELYEKYDNDNYVLTGFYQMHGKLSTHTIGFFKSMESVQKFIISLPNHRAHKYLKYKVSQFRLNATTPGGNSVEASLERKFLFNGHGRKMSVEEWRQLGRSSSGWKAKNE